jgi:hypothetical protein
MAPSSGISAAPLAPPRAAAIAGVVFSLLLGTSLVIIRLTVPPRQSDRSADWLLDPSRLGTVRLAIQLIPFAGIAFLWFIGVLRNRLGGLEDQFFATVFLGSGLLFVASLFATGAFSASVVEAVANGHPLSSDTYFLIRQLIGAFLNVFAIKMAGVFMFSTSMIVFRTRILPRWVSFLGFLCAMVLLLVITSWPWIALLFPLWMLVVSTTVLLTEFHRGRLARQ